MMEMRNFAPYPFAIAPPARLGARKTKIRARKVTRLTTCERVVVAIPFGQLIALLTATAYCTTVDRSSDPITGDARAG